eukprot:TRINITY_DN6341_c0_g1_i1.p1 TRINITY_DN6341_c0_g1~~TRINITY_DN6341_c0_g1_i1.p1  ORF type:complete len:380 (+),score=69.60 TRINITY_DN6341_c0_g1_i1:66-1205(+)
MGLQTGAAALLGAAAGAAGTYVCLKKRVEEEKQQTFHSFTTIKTVTVYASSSVRLPQEYFRDAKAVGQMIAKKGWVQVNGGGGRGLMGAATDGSLEAGGIVDGVILDKFIAGGHKGIRSMRSCNNMPDRKRLLYEAGNAYIALPGGLGTLEEIMEVVSWRQLGFHDCPVAFINTQGYYSHVGELLDMAIESGFISKDIRSSYIITADINRAISFIATYQPVFIDKTKIHRGEMSSEMAALRQTGSFQPMSIQQQLGPPIHLAVGMRVMLLTTMTLNRFGELPAGSVGTVTKIPGDVANSIAEVDFDGPNFPLVDVFRGGVKVIPHDASSPLRQQRVPPTNGHNPSSPSGQPTEPVQKDQDSSTVSTASSSNSTETGNDD